MTLPVIVLFLIGVLCVLYGLMVFLIRSGTVFFAVWLLLGGFLLLWGLLVQIHFFDRIPKSLRVFLISAMLVSALIFLLCEGFVLRGFGSRAPADVDYLIVLGAQVRESGPSVVLKYRLDAAADYLRTNESTLCIVTGGQGANEPVPEGTAMKQYLTECGIDESRIIVEDQARNTVQNIQFSMQLLPSPDASVALVTNNFHVSRALALAKKQGLVNSSAVSAPSDPLFLPNNMFREFFGLVKDFTAGNL